MRVCVPTCFGYASLIPMLSKVITCRFCTEYTTMYYEYIVLDGLWLGGSVAR